MDFQAVYFCIWDKDLLVSAVQVNEWTQNASFVYFFFCTDTEFAGG